MAPQKQQKPPSDEEPAQQEIVVAPEEITERPSQLQSTGNSHDRPASLQVATATINPLGEDQRELPKSDDSVFATGHGKKVVVPQSDNQTPSKKARPAKASGKWCKNCMRIKTQPGIGGRTRRNAKHGCEECAKLRGEARPRGKRQAGHSSTSNGQGTPPATQVRPRNSRPPPRWSLSFTWQKQNPGETAQSIRRKEWKLAAGSKQRQGQNRGFDPPTDSDDPDNPTKPNTDNPQVDFFGKPKDPSLSLHQIQATNATQGRYTQPSAAAVLTPALNMNNPFGVAGQHNQPSLCTGHNLLAMQMSPGGYFTSPLVRDDNYGPQQQRPGERSGAFDLISSLPSSSFGAPSGPNRIQSNAGSSSALAYPDATSFALSETPNDANDANGDKESSNTYEVAWCSMDYESTGGPTAMAIHNTSEASSPAPIDFSGMPGSPNLAPADPPVPQRRPGLQPGSINPTLSGAPH